ncbi:MAG: maleylpyruvate isomerase family mycothiol-dependent enzyme [Propionibacteriales bacterium]|nr:maleylpyruvate isomerase family mycothiol-dependent enzyme [Propionibacteriales bacterium]
MDKAEGWLVVDEQRVALADLLQTLTPEEWAAASLCDGWTVRDVAAHLPMAALTPTIEVLVAAARARGSFNRMIHDTAVRRAATQSPTQIIADLRSTVGSRRLAPTTFWRDPLLDILVHTQDIARPIGRTVAMPTDATRTALDWAWKRGFPFFPARRLRGIRMVAADADWQRGDGAEVRGPVGALLLLSTGRLAALADLTGPGLSRLVPTEAHPTTTDRAG